MKIKFVPEIGGNLELIHYQDRKVYLNDLLDEGEWQRIKYYSRGKGQPLCFFYNI